MTSPVLLYPVAHVAAAALGLVFYVAMSHFAGQRRHASAALAWVVAIIAFPFPTIPLFLLIGSRKFARPALPVRSVSAAAQAPSTPDWAADLSLGLGLPPARSCREVRLLEGGREAFDALVELVEGARGNLDMCTFLFASDQCSLELADALAASARRGVRVRLLLDAVGGVRISREIRQSLLAAGVEIRRFMPFFHNFWRGRENLRNHRKFAIADGARIWSGGRNIADEYFFDRPGRPAWRDLSFVVDGGLSADACKLFEADWRLAGGAGEAGGAKLESLVQSGPVAQLIPSGPDQAGDTLLEFLLNATYQARTRILAASPYFVPDESLLQALASACRRGVQLRLAIPRRSNHRLADWARERALRELAAAGAEILLLPEMSHAKLVIVDEAVAVSGSANLDGRSLLLNFEVAAAFYSAAEIDRLAHWHQALSARARPYVAVPPSLARDVLEGLVLAVGFQL